MRVKPIKNQVVFVMGAVTPTLAANLKIRLSSSPLTALGRLLGRISRMGRAVRARTTGALRAVRARRLAAKAVCKRPAIAQAAPAKRVVRARRVTVKRVSKRV